MSLTMNRTMTPASGGVPMMAAGDWGLLGVMSLMFGGAFTFIELGLRAADPVSLMAMRVTFGGLALALVLGVTGRTLPRGWRVWRNLIVIGMLNTVIPFSLIMWAQTHLTSGLSSILNASAPVFAVSLAHVFIPEEKLRAHRLTGVLIGLAGLAVVIGPQALNGADTSLGAQIAVLGAALSYALAGIYGRRNSLGGLEPVQAAAGMLIGAALCAVPLAFLLGAPLASLAALPDNGAALAGLAGLVLVSTASAYPLYFVLLRRIGVGNLLLVTILAPVVGVFLGVAVLDETLALSTLLGLAIILAGLLVMDGRLRLGGRS